MKIKQCKKCQEEAIAIELQGNWFVRLRRWSKCKAYQKVHSGKGGKICQTGLYKTKQAAISEWNEKYGN